MTEMHDEAESVEPIEIELTGHAQIDETLVRLRALDDLDITSHPAEFDAMHGVLRESLANAGRDDAGRDGVPLDSP